MYNFRKIDKCNMCGSNSHNHQLLGKDLIDHKEYFLKKKSMIFLPIYINVLSTTIFTNPIPYPNSGFKDMKNSNYLIC